MVPEAQSEAAAAKPGAGRRGLCPGRTAEEVERALALLVEQGMVDVEGDQITVPARFQYVDKAG